jgi:RNA repair pathway DNA polymerase beta family
MNDFVLYAGGNLYAGENPALKGSRLLYRVLAGSHATNLVTEGSDEDWRGVYQVPTRQLLGLKSPPETIEVPPDTTYWELAHFARLCLRGNPNIMELLWACPDPETDHPCSMTAVTTPVMNEVIAIRKSFFTTSMIDSYLGWVTKERRILGNAEKADKLTGKRGSHLVRMLMGLHTALKEGYLPVWLEDEDRDICLAIKNGEWTQTQVLFTIDMLKEQCKGLAVAVHWPEPDPRPIEDIVIRARMEML